MAAKTKTLHEKFLDVVNSEHGRADEFVFKTLDGTYVAFITRNRGVSIYEVEGALKPNVKCENFLENTLIEVMEEFAELAGNANVRGRYYGCVYQ